MAGENAPSGGGTPATAAVDTGNVDVNELINQVVGKRVKKAMEKAMADLRGDLASVVREAMGSKPTDKPAEQQPGAQSALGNSAQEQEKLTLKALQEQIQREQKARQDLESRLREADQRARDVRMRSEVERRFAAKLGAENPALSLLMDSFYDVKKRVVDHNGVPHVKFKSQYGDEDDLRPLDDAVVALFDKGGEFHHLVAAQSKAGSLPINGQANRQYGQTVPQLHVPQNQRVNPLLGSIAEALSDVRPEAAQIIMNDAARMGANGSAK